MHRHAFRIMHISQYEISQHVEGDKCGFAANFPAQNV